MQVGEPVEVDELQLQKDTKKNYDPRFQKKKSANTPPGPYSCDEKVIITSLQERNAHI